MRQLLILLVTLFSISISANAQVDTKQTQEDKTLILSSGDSLYLDYIKSIAEAVKYSHPRYKLYKTENMYILIKLDTATGALWQVQYGINKSSSAMVVPINESSIPWAGEKRRSGRYELYPTNNIYTFILLDTENGHTYQVQWGTNPSDRFRQPLN